MKYRVKRHTVVQPLDPSYRLIPLTQGQVAKVDIEDFEWISQWNWRAQWVSGQQSFIAVRGEGIVMSRVLMKCGPKEEADHRNFDTLDNRKNNLRKCTHLQNSQHRNRRRDNFSGFKGVTLDKISGRWAASIKIPGGARKKIGRFSKPEEAAHAYDAAAKIYHGQFACLNFPE